MEAELNYDPVNLELEIALTKIARALFDYTKSQTDSVELGRVDPLLKAFQKVANDYHKRTNSLDPNLGDELIDWHDSVRKMYEQGLPQLDPHFKEDVDVYGRIPQDIIRGLENKLGLAQYPDN